MGKEDRKEAILKLMRGGDEFRRPVMSPSILHANLEERAATFSKATTRRLMQELESEGKLEYWDESKGYYQITTEGEIELEELDK